jgi:hypothetical protein
VNSVNRKNGTGLAVDGVGSVSGGGIVEDCIECINEPRLQAKEHANKLLGAGTSSCDRADGGGSVSGGGIVEDCIECISEPRLQAEEHANKLLGAGTSSCDGADGGGSVSGGGIVEDCIECISEPRLQAEEHANKLLGAGTSSCDSDAAEEVPETKVMYIINTERALPHVFKFYIKFRCSW